MSPSLEQCNVNEDTKKFGDRDDAVECLGRDFFGKVDVDNWMEHFDSFPLQIKAFPFGTTSSSVVMTGVEIGIDFSVEWSIAR